LPEGGKLNSVMMANLPEPLTQRRRFTLSASLDYRLNADESPQVLERNLALPKGLNPRSLALAEEWKTLPPEKIVEQALTLFGSADYSYTLEPPLLGQNAVDDFLFVTKRGFCEHFSSAFVVLMRAAGIPARTVGGYQGGDYNPVDGYFIVRQSEAHAWAEVWLAGRGWVRVDPTFAVAPSRVTAGLRATAGQNSNLPASLREPGAWLRDLRYRWEAVNNAWNQYILGYTPQRQRDFLAWLGMPDTDWRRLTAILAAIGGLLLILVAFWSLYRRPPEDAALRLWNKALRRLRRRQVNCAPGETPLALLQRVRTEKPELAAPLAAVTEAYLLARYGEQARYLQTLREAIARLP
jgi:transglutaminase-like putative cysteine protease